MGEINQNTRKYVGIDIGGTNLRISFCNRSGIIFRIKTLTSLDGDNTTIPNQSIHLIKDCSKKLRISMDSIAAIGVSACSPFRSINGESVMVSANLCGGLSKEKTPASNDWEYIPVERELKKLNIPIVIQNDAQALVMAERLFGSAKNEDNCIYVTWGTGIGFGIIVDGHLLKGKNKNAGHSGHQYVSDNLGQIFGYGNVGDLESLISGKALEKIYGAPAKRIFADFRNSVPKSQDVINLAAKRFAIALYNVAITVDTKLIVIGGSVFYNNDDILLPLIRTEFFKHLILITKGINICKTSLGEFAGDIAALSLVRVMVKSCVWKS